MKILTVIPTQEECDSFVQACLEQGYQAQALVMGKLSITYFPVLEMAVAHGGLGKAQFAVQTQHLIDAGNWGVVICAGAAGALASGLSVGDVVIATETVEHDIRNKFGKPLLPRFSSSERVLGYCRQALQADPTLKVHYGPIASGDEDVMDVERRAAIHQLTEALAVAWEGAGGARASQFSGVPFIEIRGVTDGADNTAARDFHLNVRRALKSVAQVVIALARWSSNRPRTG
jgi:adenosylhomocysteine nucleosidase